MFNVGFDRKVFFEGHAKIIRLLPQASGLRPDMVRAKVLFDDGNIFERNIHRNPKIQQDPEGYVAYCNQE